MKFIFKVLFAPIIYVFKKLPFSYRRKFASKTVGSVSLLKKIATVFRYIFSYEKGKDSTSGSGLLFITVVLFTLFVVWAYFAKFD